MSPKELKVKKKPIKIINKFNDYPMHRFIEECKKTQDAEKNLAKYVLDNAHSISNINLIEMYK
jgi:hypothetical protein